MTPGVDGGHFLMETGQRGSGSAGDVAKAEVACVVARCAVRRRAGGGGICAARNVAGWKEADAGWEGTT